MRSRIVSWWRYCNATISIVRAIPTPLTIAFAAVRASALPPCQPADAGSLHRLRAFFTGVLVSSDIGDERVRPRTASRSGNGLRRPAAAHSGARIGVARRHLSYRPEQSRMPRQRPAERRVAVREPGRRLSPGWECPSSGASAPAPDARAYRSSRHWSGSTDGEARALRNRSVHAGASEDLCAPAFEISRASGLPAMRSPGPPRRPAG